MSVSAGPDDRIPDDRIDLSATPSGSRDELGRSAPHAFHVAFAMADIEKAAARFESVLGVRFHRPVYRETLTEYPDDPTPRVRRVLMTYSWGGPPYFELLQNSTPDQPEGFHHVGVWAPDVPDQRTRNSSAGLRDELVVPHTDRPGIRCWTNDPSSFYGVRIEFFDRAWKPTFDEWVTSQW